MSNIKIAYFSAEIGVDPEIKTYSGGLGILAGDTIKAMADLNVPALAVTLLYKKGFLKQKINNDYQEEEEDSWDFMSKVSETGKEVIVNIFGEDVRIKAWQYVVEGVSGAKVPIYLLDTDMDYNPEWAREITNRLYLGDRLSQEIVLGIGGFRILEALGHTNIEKYHMNEGHSALLTLELYKKIGRSLGWDDGLVKDKCVFTTHTPIPAGHDKFPYEDLYERLKGEKDLIPWHIKKLAGEDEFNMTRLAMSLSSFINAVSRKHRDVTEEMFPDFTIDYVTNGVHSSTWAGEHMQALFDEFCIGWREDFSKISLASKIPNQKIIEAHKKAKKELIDYIQKNSLTSKNFEYDVLTIGFARRFVAYKDAELIFRNMHHLARIGKKIQFIFAGKSHAKDGIGKEIMKRIIRNARELDGKVSIAFIEDYKIEIAKKLVSGCDIWLNTPIPPNEASGTSGMKAGVNGCLHMSRLDGWAIESYEMNGGGFPICEYQDFITQLEYKVIPMFYSSDKSRLAEEMKRSIIVCGSYFNTHRMVREYLKKGYKINSN